MQYVIDYQNNKICVQCSEMCRLDNSGKGFKGNLEGWFLNRKHEMSRDEGSCKGK